MTTATITSERTDINRPMITISVMLCTILVALDGSLATIALPHIQGALSATDDQVGWVVTLYFVTLAISTATSGWLAGRIGRKKLYIGAMIGFTLSSMLSGASTSLEQLVFFRMLQGLFSGPIIPMAQATIMDTYPQEKHGQALSWWATGTLVAPIFGPSIGGVLTEIGNWRWVFYVNVPVGILAVLAAITFFVESPKNKERKFDWFGFCALAVAMVSFQLMLDRGERNGWFDSVEIIFECLIGLLALYVFVVHIATGKNPFISLAILKDRNTVLGLWFVFFNGLLVFSTNVILPLFLQHIRGFPILTAGLALGPRGVGTMMGMLLAGRLVTRMEPRALLIFGYCLIAFSSYYASRFTASVDMAYFMSITFIYGAGFGFIWVPMVTMTFATLAPQYRTEASAMWALCRNYGVGTGTAVIIAVLSHSNAENRASLAEVVNPYNESLQAPLAPPLWDPNSVHGLVALEAEISRQSWMIGFVNDFRLLFIGALVMIPLALLLSMPKTPSGKRPS